MPGRYPQRIVGSRGVDRKIFARSEFYRLWHFFDSLGTLPFRVRKSGLFHRVLRFAKTPIGQYP